MFVGILDTTSGELTYANAGHNPPYTVDLQGQARQLPSTQGLALGVMPDMDYVTQTMRLRSGDLLLAYTDGVTEAFNAEQQAFGEGRLEALLCAHFERPPHALVKEVFQQLSAFAGQAPQSDDITVAALRWADASAVS